MRAVSLLPVAVGVFDAGYLPSGIGLIIMSVIEDAEYPSHQRVISVFVCRTECFQMSGQASGQSVHLLVIRILRVT